MYNFNDDLDVEFINEEGMPLSISNESERRYVFSKDGSVTEFCIQNPVWLTPLPDGTHIIQDEDGINYYISPDFIAMVFFLKEPPELPSTVGVDFPEIINEDFPDLIRDDQSVDFDESK